MSFVDAPTSCIPYWKHDEDYYSHLIGRAPVCLGRVTTDKVKGKCMVAVQNIGEGDVVLKERALTWSQNLDQYNKGVPVCGMCLRSLESPQDIVDRALPKMSSRTLPQLPEGTNVGATAVPCRSGCGQAFCCPTCESEAHAEYHRELCPATMSEASRNALKAYESCEWEFGGIDYTDTFFVALKTIAMTLAKSRGGGGEGTAAVGLAESYHRFDLLIKIELEKFAFLYLLDDGAIKTRAGYTAYRRDPLAHPKVVTAHARTPIGPVLAKAHELLSAVFGFSAEEKAFFDHKRISLLCGMILLNGQERSPNSPYVEYTQIMKSTPSTKKELSAFHANVRQHKADGITKLHGSTQGQGVYRIGACFNHSCEPNMHIAYDETTNNETLVAVALRPIAEKEELTISYIDEDLPFLERQLQLYDHYMFVCMCPKCKREATEKSQ
eukprot:PhM_4_TR12805/c0_g1_i1/m.21156